MPAKPICVDSSDWHLERYAWAKHPTLAGDAYFGLQQVISFCLDNSLPLIAPGDLFDKNYPDSYSVSVAFEQLDKMQSANLPVYFIQGQHEMTRDAPWLSLHTWPQHVNKRTFEISPFTFYGLDYQRPEDAIEELDNIPKVDTLIAHQVWGDFMGCNIVRPECYSTDVPNVSFILSGDFHRLVFADTTGKNRQDVKMISTGPLCMQSINEATDKYFVVMYDDGSFKEMPLKTRPVYKHELDYTIDWTKWSNFIDENCVADDSLPEKLRKPILYLKYPASLQNSFSMISKIVGDRFHVFHNPVSESVPSLVIADAQSRSQELKVDLSSCLERLCDSMFADDDRQKQTVQKYASRMLRSFGLRSAREELMSMEADYFDSKEPAMKY